MSCVFHPHPTSDIQSFIELCFLAHDELRIEMLYSVYEVTFYQILPCSLYFSMLVTYLHVPTYLPTGQTIGPLTLLIQATVSSHKVISRLTSLVARSTSPFVRPFPVASVGGTQTALPVWTWQQMTMCTITSALETTEETTSLSLQVCTVCLYSYLLILLDQVWQVYKV